jgi:hypothetical protein
VKFPCGAQESVRVGMVALLGPSASAGGGSDSALCPAWWRKQPVQVLRRAAADVRVALPVPVPYALL